MTSKGVDTLNVIVSFVFIMLRTVKIYFGNAAKFSPEKLFTLNDYTVNENGEVFNKNNEKLKEWKRYGYKNVILEINGVKKYCKVHRIVACTFTDICGDFNEVVNHLDENKLNNCANNLKWTTSEENLAWGTITERRTKTTQETIQIKNFLKVVYKTNGIKYSHLIRLKRLKTCYKIVDKLNNFCLHLSFEDVEKILNNKKEELGIGAYFNPIYN